VSYSPETLIEAIRRIDTAALGDAKFIGKLLFIIRDLEQHRIAHGKKPLHELTDVEIIAEAIEGL